MKIDWAVKADGTAAELQGIHFVKVYTGVHQQCGWIGETSTEITGAEDLHLTTATPAVFADGQRRVYAVTGLYLGSDIPAERGIYIVREGAETKKITRL